MSRVMWTKKIPFILKAEDCTTETNGFLSMTRSGSFYRAVLRVHGETGRTYGTNQDDAYQTAKDVLYRFPGRIGDMEMARVLGSVEDIYGLSLSKFASKDVSSEATPVATVHQIYGLFRDGKSMPFLFQNSQIFLFLAIRIVGPVQARE